MKKSVFLAATVLLVLSLFSVFYGVANVQWSMLFSDWASWIIVVESRLPRTIAVILTGIALSVSGMIMQIAMHNRFVEPSTAGTSQGAALGLVGVMLLAPSASIMTKMLVAALTSFAALSGFLLISRRIPTYDKLLLPLVGIVYGGIIGAFATFFAYQYDLLQILKVWFSGDFSAVLRGRYELLWLSGIAAAVIYILADRLTIIGMGEEFAHSLGINYRQLVLISLACVSLMTSLVVITVGSISFLGLVMPNIVRRFTGDNLRKALPWTAWLSVVMLLICDLLARWLRFPYEIPVNSIFGVLGAGLFLYLLLAKKKCLKNG